MAKKKEKNLDDEADKIKAKLDSLKTKKKKLEEKEETLKKPKAKAKSSPKSKETKEKKTKSKKAEKSTKKTKAKETKEKKTKSKKAEKSAKKTKAKETKEKKTKSKKAEKPKVKEKKKTKKQLEEEARKEKEERERTLEEELEKELSDEEIENFQIEKVDMERLTNKVCEMLAVYEGDGVLQSELWKKLKLTSRDGSRLALKLERTGIINREKILEKGRWTYKLILKKTPISTQSIENAPCLICPVEQKCSLEGEVSPRTCQWIEEWVLAEIKKPKKSQ